MLPVPATGVCVVVTPETLLGFCPAFVLVTWNVTVQFVPAGKVRPLKLRLVWPTVRVLELAPEQVPPTVAFDALMFTRLSVNAPPVSEDELGLVIVMVTVESPPEEIVEGLKPFVIVGAPSTVSESLAPVTAANSLEVRVDVVFW